MTSAEPAQSPILYGRFSARLRAFLIDWMIVSVLIAAGLILATTSGSQNISRIVGYSFVALLILLEPVLVSTLGSTVGHYLNNLRVVDNRTGGKVSFLKATARMVIKSVLGLYSFVSMLTSSRHQALHDWVTASTVQIRDQATARPADYVHERVELSHPEMPSWFRRTAVIVGYVFLILSGWVFARFTLAPVGCIYDTCSTQEKFLLAGSDIIGIIAILLAIRMGWRGKLYGARMRRADAAQS